MVAKGVDDRPQKVLLLELPYRHWERTLREAIVSPLEFRKRSRPWIAMGALFANLTKGTGWSLSFKIRLMVQVCVGCNCNRAK